MRVSPEIQTTWTPFWIFRFTIKAKRPHRFVSKLITPPTPAQGSLESGASSVFANTEPRTRSWISYHATYIIAGFQQFIGCAFQNINANKTKHKLTSVTRYNTIEYRQITSNETLALALCKINMNRYLFTLKKVNNIIFDCSFLEIHLLAFLE